MRRRFPELVCACAVLFVMQAFDLEAAGSDRRLARAPTGPERSLRCVLRAPHQGGPVALRRLRSRACRWTQDRRAPLETDRSLVRRASGRPQYAAAASPRSRQLLSHHGWGRPGTGGYQTARCRAVARQLSRCQRYDGTLRDEQVQSVLHGIQSLRPHHGSAIRVRFCGRSGRERTLRRTLHERSTR